MIFQPTSGLRVAGACPGSSGHKVEPILDRRPFHPGLFTPTSTLMRLVLMRQTNSPHERKPEYLEKIHVDTRRTCQHHTVVPTKYIFFLIKVITELRLLKQRHSRTCCICQRTCKLMKLVRYWYEVIECIGI